MLSSVKVAVMTNYSLLATCVITATSFLACGISFAAKKHESTNVTYRP